MTDAAEIAKLESETCHESPRGIRFMKLREGLCKVPLGGPYDVPERFCGEPTPVGSPYCSKCQRIAYTRATPVSKKRPAITFTIGARPVAAVGKPVSG